MAGLNRVMAWCGNVDPGTAVPVANRFQRHPDSSRQGLRARKKSPKNTALPVTGGAGGKINRKTSQQENESTEKRVNRKNEAPQPPGPKGLVRNLEVLKPPGGVRPAGSQRGQVDGDRRVKAETRARGVRRLDAL